jgi:hypothetical protein
MDIHINYLVDNRFVYLDYDGWRSIHKYAKLAIKKMFLNEDFMIKWLKATYKDPDFRKAWDATFRYYLLKIIENMKNQEKPLKLVLNQINLTQ